MTRQQELSWDMPATLCQANSLVIVNTLFTQLKRRQYTWTSTLDESRYQIDYIMIDRDWKSAVRNAFTKLGAGSDTDHILVTAKSRLKAMKVEKPEVQLHFIKTL